MKHIPTSSKDYHHHRVYIAAKSGGHIIPALTLIRQYKTEQPDSTVTFITTDGTLDQYILEQSQDINRILIFNLPNVPQTWLRRFWYLTLCLKTYLRCLVFFIRHRPQEIVSMGGYLSIPVCIAGWILRIPLTVWELNAIPGLATSTLRSIATRIYVCFEQTRTHFNSSRCVYQPYPIQYQEKLPAYHAKKRLNIDIQTKTIFLLGGSQGSMQLNQLFTQWLSSTTHLRKVHIIHQTGKNDSINWKEWYQQKEFSAYIFSFEHDISLYYQAADLIICRAGSGTLHEIAWFEKPCFIVPLRTPQTEHQYYNAQALSAHYPNMHVVSPEQLIIHLDTWMYDDNGENNLH